MCPKTDLRIEYMKSKIKRIITPRKILVAVICLCACLIALSYVTDKLASPLREGVSQIIIPLQRGMNGIGIGAVERSEKKRNIEELQAQNEELQTKIAELEEENKSLKDDTKDLADLRTLYETDKLYESYEKTGATIIGASSQNWNTSFTIDKGSKHGIQTDMNVIADEGLVGIVSEVHGNYSIVTTIIGDNSYVSAMDEASGDICSVRGDLSLMDTGFIHVERFKEEAEVNEGDRIVTSNIATKYLPGLLVGYARDVSPDGNALTKSGKVLPAVDFDHLQKVLIIKQLKADMTSDEEEEVSS